MHLLEETNFIISGHTSSGTTSTALILAYLLQKKFVYAGGVVKFMARKLGYDPKKDLEKFEAKYGEKWDVLWENYITWKINSERNLLINSKIAGFFTDKEDWLFEAFITASANTRSKRATGDNRKEDITKRDKFLQNRWIKLFNINFLDIDEIKDTHDLFIENDNLTLAQTACEIYKTAREALGLRERFTLSDFEKIEVISNEKGKQYFYDYLEKHNLIIKTEEILAEWVEHFEDLLKDTHKDWLKVVYKEANKL